MSVRGLGTDVVAVARIARAVARHGDRFLDRCFRPAEIALARGRGAARDQALAARWAAKEAFLKALGRDVRGIPYRDIEVVRAPAGPLSLRLHGRAAEALAAGGARSCLLSISHERDLAVAVVLLTD